jgi:hypothetical protein
VQDSAAMTTYTRIRDVLTSNFDCDIDYPDLGFSYFSPNSSGQIPEDYLDYAMVASFHKVVHVLNELSTTP